MDDQKKDHIDLERTSQKNSPKQIQTQNLPSYDVENINSTNKRIDLLLSNKPWIIPWGRERMPQMMQRHRRATLHRSAHPHRERARPDGKIYLWIQYKKAYYIVPQNWIINFLEMYKISDEVINFIEKTMNTWKVELTSAGRSLLVVKFRIGIFQSDALSPLLFIIAMIPLNHILRKCTAEYKLTKSQEKINHLMYIDDIKLFAKTEK